MWFILSLTESPTVIELEYAFEVRLLDLDDILVAFKEVHDNGFGFLYRLGFLAGGFKFIEFFFW